MVCPSTAAPSTRPFQCATVSPGNCSWPRKIVSVVSAFPRGPRKRRAKVSEIGKVSFSVPRSTSPVCTTFECASGDASHVRDVALPATAPAGETQSAARLVNRHVAGPSVNW